jgi:tetratricopeptide (TPR) repeat protein
VLYLPSPKIIKALSLGYTGLVSDIYWTRAVQYFGSKHAGRARDYKLLAPLLDITTALDPKLLIAYRFGSLFLADKPPEGAGEPDRAVDLVERGITANPNEWRLYFDLGLLHHLKRKDYAAAADAFERGAKLPNAHPFLPVLAATMRQKAGDRITARALWTMIYESTADELIRDNATKHLRALQVDQDVEALEDVVRQYRERTGHEPASMADLVQAGWLRRLPRDPLGYPYKLVAGGKIEIEAPWKMPFVQKGLPPDWEHAAEFLK